METILSEFSWILATVVVAFSIETIGILLAQRELLETITHFNMSREILGSKKHVIDHIVILLSLLIFNAALLFLFLTPDFAVTLIFQHHYWTLIAIIGIIKILFANHLRNERLGLI